MEQKFDVLPTNNEVNIIEPKVSVIVATYRRDNSLKRALISLINQTYENIEIIVVDDNADVSWNSKVQGIICNLEFSGKVELIYILNEENKGSAETRNIGINRASGEYITFLDDDDVYLSQKVERQLNHMIDMNSDYSLTDLWLYDEREKLIEKRIRHYIKDPQKEKLFNYHLMYHMTGTDVMMFKKNYLLKIGGFSPINVGDEFYLMQKAIVGNGIFSYLPNCDVKAYVHTEMNGLSSGDGKIKGENELYQYKKMHFEKLSLKEKRYIKMRHYAVLAFAELRRKGIIKFIKYSFRSFFSSPISLIRILINRF